MTLTLDLPREVEAALAEEAERKGVSLEKYAISLLSAEAPQSSRLRTGAEVVEFWKREGVLVSRPEIGDSVSHAREIRDRAERRSNP
jgi:hypothetical protein